MAPPSAFKLPPFRRVSSVALDGSAAAEEIIPPPAAHAGGRSTKMVLVHVVPLSRSRRPTR